MSNTKVKFSDRVTVYATAKCRQFEEGKPVRLHPVQAAAWIKAEKATKNAPKEGVAKGKKDKAAATEPAGDNV